MDLKLVKGMFNRVTYDLLKGIIPQDLLSIHTKTCIAWINQYYRTYPDKKELTTEELIGYIKVRNAHRLDDEGVKLTLALVAKTKNEPDVSASSLYDALIEASCAGELARVVTTYQTGGEIDIIPESMDLVTRYAGLKGLKTEEPDSIEDILDSIESMEGIIFQGIPLFEEYTMPMQEGDSILIAGRPDRGKTTLLSYLLPRACPTAFSRYNGERPILWLVNEGNVNKIIPRIYQGALGCTLEEMFEYRAEGTLRQRYSEAIQAPDDFIKVLPFHGKTVQDLEMLVQQYNPSMVVIDMVEHVGGVYGGSKSEIIGNTWEKLRTLALIYKYVSIGTAQISVEGSDNLYPTYEHLAYTKTAVQGYTDMILMMGNRDVEGMETIRGLSLPKNKAKVMGKTSYPRLEFDVDFDRCQFYQRAEDLVK